MRVIEFEVMFEEDKGYYLAQYNEAMRRFERVSAGYFKTHGSAVLAFFTGSWASA
ncbi:MAG: hypothetical protein IPG66_06195 [Hydrogenophilales bacterium]|nr:hypothetical protein [Hydrogenophilales bacterium]